MIASLTIMVKWQHHQQRISWTTSWTSNSNIKISIDFASLLTQNFFTLFKKTTTMKCQWVKRNLFSRCWWIKSTCWFSVIHLKIWSMKFIKWKTIFSYDLSSSTIRKYEKTKFMKTPSQKLFKLVFCIWSGIRR